MKSLDRHPAPWLPLYLALAILGGSLACSTARPPARDVEKIETGIASWYGPKFHGRRTASGEIYDMFELTAAHKKLPFGTLVEVRRPDNGKAVTVRINDRGPFIRGRVIDLSRTAADALDLIGPGTAKVELYLVSGHLTEVFTVQVAAFRSRERARELAESLSQIYSPVKIAIRGGWHQVHVGSFPQRRDAVELQRQLRRHGHVGNVKGIPPDDA